eukprot:g2738.t1
MFKGKLDQKASGSAVFGKWKPRDFELNESTAALVYRDAGGGDKGGGTVIGATDAASEGKHLHRFDVQLEQPSAGGGAKRRTVCCCSAESEEEKQLWLEKLGAAVRT